MSSGAAASGVSALSIRDLCARLRVSRAYVYKLIAAGKFPRPVKFGERSLWLSDEVDQWIEGRRVDRDRSAAKAA